MSEGSTRVHERALASPRSPLGGKSPRWFVDRGPIALVVFVTFWFRVALADRNSYWLDELYSIQQYVLPHDTAAEAVRVLGETSIHPPLYQLSLYAWVQWFGSSETATRTLSNLAVVAAVLFVHATVVRLLGMRTGNVVAIVFSLTFGVVYYGLEARSYAFTLMLASASGYGLARLLSPGDHRAPGSPDLDGATGPTRGLRHRDPVIGATVLSLANIGLMLTHYYNFFFWGAQAIVLAVYLVVRHRGIDRWRRLAAAVGLYVTQLLVVAALWGRTMIASYTRNEGRYATDVPDNGPLDLASLAAAPSFRSGSLPTSLLLLIAIAVVGFAALHARRQTPGRLSDRFATTMAVTVGLVIGPAVVAYTAFLVAGAERVHGRYLIAMLPAITLLLATAGLWLVDTTLAAARRWSVDRSSARGRLVGRRGDGPDRGVVAAIVLASVLVVPGLLDAVGREKVDWRGTAQTVLDIVASDPEHTYTVWEPSFRRVPMFDFYFARSAGEVRVDGTITRTEDDRATLIEFEDAYDRIERHDYLVLPFVHQRAHQFPESLRRLDERYDRAHVQLDAEGRGIVIYDLR